MVLRRPDLAKRLAIRIKSFHQFNSEMAKKVKVALEEKEQYVSLCGIWQSCNGFV